MDVTEVKALIEEQGRTLASMREANETMLKAKADGKAFGDLTATVEKMSAALDTLDEKREVIEQELLAIKRLQTPTRETIDLAAEVKSFNAARRERHPQAQDIDGAEYACYKGAFFTLLRHGNLDALAPEQRKAMSAGVDPEGGFLLPPSTAGRIVTRLYDLSPIRQIATVQPTTSGEVEGIVDNGDADAGWVSETGARSETTAPTIGKYKIVAEEMHASPKVTQKLIDDAAVDVEAWLAGKVANRFARLEGAAFVVGNGVGKPRGFTAYTTAATADSSRTWGQLEHVVTGANGDFHTTKADPLQDLIMAFKTHYLASARWVTRREVIAKVRKLKEATSDRYLWEPSLQMGEPARLLGYPQVLAQDMPALATGSLSMALGDFAQGYTIVDRIGMRVLRDPFTAKPYVVFYTTARVGGAVVDFEAIKFIKFSA